MHRNGPGYVYQEAAAAHPPVAHSLRVASIVRLMTAVAFLLWSVPSVDVTRFARLMEGADTGASLAAIDRTLPYTLQEGGAPRTATLETPLPGNCLQLAVADGTTVPPLLTFTTPAGATLRSDHGIAADRRYAVDGRPVVIRGPPDRSDAA